MWPFNNCYLALLLVDGSHMNVFGRGYPSDLLLKKNRGDCTVAIIRWEPISEFRYRRLLKGTK